jgi:hypothetical protein
MSALTTLFHGPMTSAPTRAVPVLSPGDARRPDYRPVQTKVPNGVGHSPAIGDEAPAAQAQPGQPEQLAPEIVRVTV